MYWVGDSSVFLNIPCSSEKTNSPHPALLLNWFLRTHKKIWVTEVLLTSFWERSPCCRCIPPAFFSISVFTFISCILSPAKGAASVGKGLTLLSWLPLGSLLQYVISSWREKDTKTHDVFGEAQNNISGFRQQTLQMGRASPAAGEGWLKIIRQKKYCKMLPKDFKSLSGNRLIVNSCFFFQKLFIFLFQSCVSFGGLKQTSGGLLSRLRLLKTEYIWKISQSSATGLGFFHRVLPG